MIKTSRIIKKNNISSPSAILSSYNDIQSLVIIQFVSTYTVSSSIIQFSQLSVFEYVVSVMIANILMLQNYVVYMCVCVFMVMMQLFSGRICKVK
jgi:hypothetical protein